MHGLGFFPDNITVDNLLWLILILTGKALNLIISKLTLILHRLLYLSAIVFVCVLLYFDGLFILMVGWLIE